MRGWIRFVFVVVLVTSGSSGSMLAASDPASNSANYKVVESEVGTAGGVGGASGNYSFNPSVDDGGASLGESAVGSSASASYSTGAGFNTTAQPSLTLVVNTSSIDFGNLSTAAASTATATFSVKNYTSYGYVARIIGTPPTHSGHSLTALAADTASAAGVEQFGLNLRANSSPVSVGADPVQSPGATFSFGEAGDGATGTYGVTRPYTQPDKYRYSSGDVIASAPKSSGETDYTVSFLANISDLTPGGKYVGSFSILVTGTY